MKLTFFLCLLTLGVVLPHPLKMAGGENDSTAPVDKNNLNVLSYSVNGSNNITAIQIDKTYNVTSTAENNSIHIQPGTHKQQKDNELYDQLRIIYNGLLQTSFREDSNMYEGVREVGSLYNKMETSKIFKEFLSTDRYLFNSINDLKTLYMIPGKQNYVINGGNYTWKIHKVSRQVPDMDAWSIIRAAFAFWSLISDIRFSYQEGDVETDFNIIFASTHHTTSKGYGCSDFGPGILAHAYFPNTPYAGEIHFNDNQDFSLHKGHYSYSLLHVAIHEIGHAIGLRHNNDVRSIMYPYSSPNQHLDLNFNVFSRSDTKHFHKKF